jgi:menaquinone-dependent protoporphyrinogen oxidase
MTKVLVTYGTWTGTTGEVAQSVAQGLEANGLTAEARPAAEVDDVGGYDAVVVGAAIRASNPHPDAVKFIEDHREGLAKMPVAYFVVCLTMKDDTEENRCTVGAYLDSVREKVPEVEPVDVGLFAGRLDLKRLALPVRLMMKAMKAPPGDYRDEDAIHSWASELRSELGLSG